MGIVVVARSCVYMDLSFYDRRMLAGSQDSMIDYCGRLAARHCSLTVLMIPRGNSSSSNSDGSMTGRFGSYRSFEFMRRFARRRAATTSETASAPFSSSVIWRTGSKPTTHLYAIAERAINSMRLSNPTLYVLRINGFRRRFDRQTSMRAAIAELFTGPRCNGAGV